MFHSFVNPVVVTIDHEMTRTRYGLKATNQSTETEALSRGRFKWRCPWGIVCQSSQANNYQDVRSFENDNTEEFR